MAWVQLDTLCLCLFRTCLCLPEAAELHVGPQGLPKHLEVQQSIACYANLTGMLQRYRGGLVRGIQGFTTRWLDIRALVHQLT